MTAIVLAAIALAPWLTVLPLGGAAAVLAQALTLVAAFHGGGLALARLAHRPSVHPVLAIQWGVATLIAMSGVALALRIDGRVTQTVIVCAFAGVHTAVIGLRWRSYRARLAALDVRWVIVPAALLALLGVLHVLGAAGDLGARPFDDDGNVLAQLQRLRDTGTLGDPVGHARSFQLGGQLVLGALATVAGDVHTFRILEALAFVLALALVIARLRVRNASSGIWALLLVVTASAFAFAPRDPATCWTAVGLIVALHAMLTDDEPRALLPIAVVAGALITLRHELAPVGILALAVAWWPARRSSLLLAGGALAVILPFAIARLGASAPGELLVTGHASYAKQFLWPLAIAGGAIAVITLARSATLTSVAMVVSLIAIVLVQNGRDATGRVKWTRRYLDLAANIEYLRHADHAPITGGYDAILRNVPASATLAVWVGRPERLDYAAPYSIVDLRTPRGARLRTHRFDAHTSRMQRLLTAIGADYLLLETDDRYAQRVRGSYLYRFVCPTPLPACADDLEAIALAHPVVAEAPGLRLVKLR